MTRKRDGAASGVPASDATGLQKKRAGIGIADQLLYSLTNFGLTVVIARSVSPSEFGAYSLIIATYLIGIAVLRGLTSETLVVRFSASDRAVWRREAVSAAGATLVLGTLFGAGLVAFGVATSGALATSAIAIGALFPGLALQDFARFAALSCGRPTLALLNDVAQAVVQLVATVLLLKGSANAPWMFLVAWGGAAQVGAAVGLIALRLRVRPRSCMTWFRRNGPMAVRYALDDLAGQGSQQAVAYAVAGAAGLSAAGALRGAQTVFGPTSILFLSVQVAVTPELVRLRQRSLRKLRWSVLIIGAILAAAGALWGLIALALPTSVGRALFGGTWENARPLLVYFIGAQAAAGLRVGPMAGLRALGAANRTLGARFVVVLLGLAAQLAGALTDGAAGVATAIAVATPLQAIVWWWQFESASREGRRLDAAQQRAASWNALVESSPDPTAWRYF